MFLSLGPGETGIAPVVGQVPGHRFAYFYGSGMGAGGVAVGDIDRDGLPDVFLAGAPGGNRLYRQVSPLKFEDITRASGLQGDRSWSRGASMVDIDNDGDLDIYVANYGEPNYLYINQGAAGKGGPVRFVDEAPERGVNVIDACLLPSFCDYDQDGDLDFYLVTNEYIWPYRSRPPDPKRMIGERDGKPVINPPFDKFFKLTEWRRDPSGNGFQVKWDRTGRPDFLLKNDGRGHFTEVTVQAGMQHGNGRGLSATWWDYNGDGAPDLYVANDWMDRDFLYHNNGDGTFRDATAEAVPYTPMFTMGADARGSQQRRPDRPDRRRHVGHHPLQAQDQHGLHAGRSHRLHGEGPPAAEHAQRGLPEYRNVPVAGGRLSSGDGEFRLVLGREDQRLRQRRARRCSS